MHLAERRTRLAGLLTLLLALSGVAFTAASSVGTGNPVIVSPTATDALYQGYTGPFVVDFEDAPIATYHYAVFRDPVGAGASTVVAGPYSYDWTGVGAQPQFRVKALAAEDHLRFKVTDRAGHTAELSFVVRPGSAPRCALVVPTRVRVNAPVEKVVGRLNSTCATLHTATADWKVTHAGAVLDYFRFDHTSTDTWSVFDTDPTGSYLIVPLSARSSTNTEVPQNTPSPVVRRDARLALGGTRSGSTLSLHATLSRYSPNADGFRRWASRSVVLAYRTCSGCPWKQLRTLTTNAHGEAGYRFSTTGARDYRISAGGTSVVWAPLPAYGRF